LRACAATLDAAPSATHRRRETSPFLAQLKRGNAHCAKPRATFATASGLA
jgi:hypothetical protein